MTDISPTGSQFHEIAALAESQHGIVSRDQLRALGLGDSAITNRARTGYLRPVFRGVFAVGHGAISRTARMCAATLACGAGAVLSHGSACELIGLWGTRPILIDVIPPKWSGRGIQGIRWHRVRLPEAEEIEIRNCIPCTSPSRTLVDMAGRCGQTSLRRLIEQAAILRVLDPGEIDRILALGRRRGATLLRALLDPWRSTAERPPKLRSPLEARLLSLLVSAGLPSPRCNVKMQIDAHWLEIDMLWEKQRLAIETDGEETHATKAAFQRDRWRDQLLIAAGYRTARVTWAQVHDEPAAVVKRIANALNA